MIEVGDGRAQRFQNEKKKNIEKVRNWFKKNKGKTAKQCAEDKEVGLSYRTVLSHIKEIQSMEAK